MVPRDIELHFTVFGKQEARLSFSRSGFFIFMTPVLAGLLSACDRLTEFLRGFDLCCDPMVSLFGAFWPAWMISLFAAFWLTIALRYLFAVTRIESHLGQLVLIYPSLWVLLACLIWLALYQG